jgi:hypothetical protein
LYRKGKLKLVGAAAEVDTSAALSTSVEEMVEEMLAKDWEVYIKAFESAEKVLEYLSRYVHQVAISNYRIVNIVVQKSFCLKRYEGSRASVSKVE